jgi:hypothetical protein
MVLASPPSPLDFFHSIHTFPQIFFVSVIDTNLRKIYLPRQIEPGSLQAFRFVSETAKV